MASASSIKQILLEWCRSKTLGYQVSFGWPWGTLDRKAAEHCSTPESLGQDEKQKRDTGWRFLAAHLWLPSGPVLMTLLKPPLLGEGQEQGTKEGLGEPACGIEWVGSPAGS